MTLPGIKLRALPAGTAFVRAVALHAKHGDNIRAALDEARKYPDTPQVERYFEMQTPAGRMDAAMRFRTAVDIGSTAEGNRGNALSASGVVDDFLPLVAAGSALGAIRQRAREIPFTSSIPMVNTAASAYWVSEGTAKPLTSIDLSGISLPPKKITSMIVISRELAELSTPSAERVLRQVLIDGIGRSIDVALFDQTVVASDSQPASLTSGAVTTSSVSSGTTTAAIQADLTAMLDGIAADMQWPLWVMRPSSALRLALLGLTSPDGQTIGGAPIHRTLGIPAGVVALVDVGSLRFSGGGEMEVAATENASLQLSDAPTSAAANAVSLWENNLVGIRAELFFNFVARTGSVAVMTDATW